MANKTSTGRKRYQGLGSNNGGGFGRGRADTYGRGQGCGFNPIKIKV